ncbi:phosphatidylserine decarboxylase family protein [Marinoscillum furvescens]|uniref:Phosphatidylserine decarboxylase proenzyme n=1 Tax=Marinoscillum furvescens DSM 4134 TaxID=1122208 RepID=A0A3D9L519_MARFU|nr:phosphatidylserine decarboxylase family protein [Marinoscillum furvescens]RED99582.1 phosphatidylserine decarboxylase [Marinoscillum furvescens DSM 4134]
MNIHKEGKKIIPVAALILGLLYALLYWLIPFQIVQIVLGVAAVIFFILVVRFFRDPEFPVAKNPKQIIAPADGKVVVIEETEESEYLKDRRIQVSIFMSPLNVHVNRSPVAGEISYFKYHPGKFLVAWHPKSSTDNERTSIGLKLPSGVEIMMRQVAGAVARRICFYSKTGDTVEQGDKFGFIRFGSRIDLYLPLDADIKVDLNEISYGGKTIIAELP